MRPQDTKLEIIGIGGLPRSGKDMLAEMFIALGFFGVSLGDIVRNITRTRHADKPDPISRANTTETSGWLRRTRGPDFALVVALSQYEIAKQSKDYKGLLVWSVRAPVEVDHILKNDGRLVWVEASDQTRYDRYLKNIRDGEIEISLDEFKRQEDEQWKPSPHLPPEIQMNVSYVKSHATDIIENNLETLNEFRQRAREFIGQI